MRDGYVKTGRNNSAFVQPSGKVYNDLSRSVVVDDFELADVSVLHHHSQKLDDDFGARPDEDLPLASLLGIVYGFKSVAQYVHTHHNWKQIIILAFFETFVNQGEKYSYMMLNFVKCSIL